MLILESVKKIILLCLMPVLPVICLAQINKDSILLNENTLTRPITVHAGQLQINGSYGLSINSKRYDDDGNVIHLNDEGLTNIRHTFFFEARYGILEYIGINASIAHKSEAERAQMSLLLASPDPSIETSQVTDIKGFTDLYLGIDARLPVKTKIFELGGSAGINLPTAKSNPDQPTHEYNYDPSYVTLLYHFNNHWGRGVPVSNFGGQFKLRTGLWGLYGSWIYRKALKEGESITWKYYLENNKIQYYSETYQYALSAETDYLFRLEYQPIPWVNVFAAFQGYSSSKGWSEKTTKKVAEPIRSFNSLNPGFEIVVTPKFWLRQQMIIPLGGKNDFGPFGITTSVSYNLFPFYRHKL